MGSTFSSEQRVPSWALDRIEEVWNEYSAPLKLRSFSLGKAGTKSKAATRLSLLLRDNAEWLDGSAHTDVEVLFDRLIEKLIAALKHCEFEGLEVVNELLDRPVQKTLGFWAFCRDLKNVHYLASYFWGLDPVEALERDKERRTAKAEILSEWKAELNEHLRRLAYLSGSDELGNARLKHALEGARRAMAEAEDLISRERPRNDPVFRVYEADYIEAAPEDKELILKRWRDGYYAA